METQKKRTFADRLPEPLPDSPGESCQNSSYGTGVAATETGTYQRAFRPFSIESLIGHGTVVNPSSSPLAAEAYRGMDAQMHSPDPAAVHHAVAETADLQHFRLSALFNSMLEQQQRAAAAALELPLKFDYFKVQRFQAAAAAATAAAAVAAGKTFSPPPPPPPHAAYCASAWPYSQQQNDALHPVPRPQTAFGDESDDADDDSDDAQQHSPQDKSAAESCAVVSRPDDPYGEYPPDT